ncbi:MAG: hypothetical protein ABSB13_08000 [Candidatus Binatus sp.]|jgi:hypothetical protein|uniref:hypothetical protein n=1 Tax=Candidatus Binatus sp. TaxID=2811406 RepID=UPI003D10CA1B
MARATAAVAAIIMMVATCAVARAQNYVIDQGASDALTRYLHLNSLPMVTAEFSTSPGGSRQVILTGFVATQFGRQDAERIALAYVNDPSVNMVDQILLDPHVEDMRTAPPGSPAAVGSQSPNSPNQLWNKTMQGIYKNGAQNPPASGPMLP